MPNSEWSEMANGWKCGVSVRVMTEQKHLELSKGMRIESHGMARHTNDGAFDQGTTLPTCRLTVVIDVQTRADAEHLDYAISETFRNSGHAPYFVNYDSSIDKVKP